jgi:uncharacterized integral membrane protein
MSGNPDNRKRNLKLVAGLVLAGLIVLFTLQNAEVVELRFLFWKLSASRAVMIFSVLAVGIVLGWILRGWRVHKKTLPPPASK